MSWELELLPGKPWSESKRLGHQRLNAVLLPPSSARIRVNLVGRLDYESDKQFYPTGITFVLGEGKFKPLDPTYTAFPDIVRLEALDEVPEKLVLKFGVDDKG